MLPKFKFQARDYKGDESTVIPKGTCLVASIPEFNLYWTRDKTREYVQYGLSLKEFGIGSELQAAHCYGECILHANPVPEE